MIPYRLTEAYKLHIRSLVFPVVQHLYDNRIWPVYSAGVVWEALRADLNENSIHFLLAIPTAEVIKEKNYA